MAKSKLMKFVGCAALAGVSYAAGRVIGFFSGVGWSALMCKSEPKCFAKAADDGVNFVKQSSPTVYAELLKKYPGLEEPESPDIQVTTNQPED